MHRNLQNARRSVYALLLGILLLLLHEPAMANAQLAVDKGCFKCHGEPPRKNMPSFAQLAADYAKVRSDPAKQAKLAEKLRNGSILKHVDAHERLSEADATRLVRWIADGALAQ